MPLSCERVVWVAIPAGTPTHKRRLSVMVAPRIEGTGKTSVCELPRLQQWTRYVEELLEHGLLEVRVNGHRVESTPVRHPDLPLDPDLWPKLFELELEVDLVDLSRELEQAARHEGRVPIVSPSAQGAGVFKGLYRQRVAQQVGASSASVKPFFTTVEFGSEEPDVRNWASYIEALRNYLPPLEVPPKELEREAVRHMEIQEMFHGRPRLRVYPDLVRDERELGERSAFRPLAATAGRLTLGATDPPATLPKLDTAGPMRIARGSAGSIVTAARANAGLVAAAPGDRIVADGCAFRLRPGDEIELVPTDDRWECGEVVVQVQHEDDDAILYARHLCSSQGPPKRIVFVLPPSPPDGFAVTLRSLEQQPVTVRGAGLTGASTDLVAGQGRIYRYTGARYESETEDREELHRRLASLRSYPALLRRLGLVVDLDLPDGLPASGNVRVVPLTDDAMSDLCPCTRYQITAASNLFQPVPAAGSTSRNGFLSNTDSRARYKLVQLDAETAALKNLQQARSQRHYLEIPEKKRNAVALDARGKPDEGGDLPSLRQIGLALCDTDAIREAQTALARAGEVIEALCPTDGIACHHLASSAVEPAEGDCAFFTEDLLVGFRVDVRRRQRAGAVGPWRSLCDRHGEYSLGRANPTQWVFRDEGYLSPAADEVGDPGSSLTGVRFSQALFRWDGWSLVAARPGEVISERSGGLVTIPDQADPAAPVRVRFRPQPGSLERLRLGDRYDFRLRTVDLAGNSLSVTEADDMLASAPLDDPRIFYSGCYERLEPVTPPVLVPAQKPGLGESNDQLVIRSGDRAADTREWLLLPPGANPSFVELHGALDHQDPTDSYRMIAAHDGEAPAWDGTQRGYDETWLAQRWSRLSGQLRLPYLPDPMAHSALFRQKDITGKAWAVAALELTRQGKHLRYPDCHRARLLSLAPGAAPGVRDSGHALQFCLPPGRMANLEVATCPSEHELHRFGLLNWCLCPGKDGLPCDEVEPAGEERELDPAAVHAACCAGEIGLLTPSKQITLVHAVEKPLIPAGRKSLGIATEQTFRFGNPVRVTLDACGTGAGTSAGCVFGLEGTAWLDRPSTGKLDIRVEWTEPLDIPELPEVLLRPHALQPFQVPVPLALEDFVLLPSHPSARTCENVAPASAAKPCTPRDSLPFAGPVRFEDGKHRKVSLTFDATSRFVSFFQDPNAGEDNGEPAAKDLSGRFRRRSDAVTVHFPARIVPPLPSPLYMVPTFRTSQEADGKERRFKRHGGVRIYFERDRFVTGEDEMLAVVFAPTRTAQLPSPLDQLVSAWGADPFWESPAMDKGVYERTESGLPFLPERPLLDDVQNPERTEPSLITPLRFAPPAEDDGAGNVVELAEVELSIAAYTPRLDKTKNLWAVDVDIQAPTYFPFLRLGLARYQPYAETGKELSGIVPATFCQLVPDVTVSVVPVRKKCYEITVTAPASYSNLAGNNPIRRTFEAIVIRTRSGPKDLAYAVQDNGPPVELQWVSDGDGEAKWLGVVDSQSLKCAQGLLILERQSWGRPLASRVVGASTVLLQ